MHFMNKHHKVSFSYHFIFDIIMCVLATFYKRGHFVMLIIKSMHLIKLHFWTYLCLKGLASTDDSLLSLHQIPYFCFSLEYRGKYI